MSRSKEIKRPRSPEKRQLASASAQTFFTPTRVTISLAALFLIGALLRLHHLGGTISRTPDEQIYTRNARRIVERGFGEFPAMVREYNQDPVLPRYPSPVRAGLLVMIAGAMKLTGIMNENAGAVLSCLFSVAGLALAGVIGARFFPPWAAIYGMLYLALSLPDLMIARRCWGDALMSLLGSLMLWAACEITRNHKRWWTCAVLVAAGSFSILVKEFGAFIYGACVVYVLAILIRRRAWRTIGGLALSGIAGAALIALVLVTVSGGLDAYLTAQRRLMQATHGNVYGEQYQSGPWYGLIEGFWVITSVNLILWAISIGASLLPERRLAGLNLTTHSAEVPLVRLFPLATLLVAAMMLILPIAQSFRYMAPVHSAMYLSGGIGFVLLWRLAAVRMQNRAFQAFCVVTAVVTLSGAIAGYRHFTTAFVERGIPDLSIKLVLDSRD